MPVFPPSGRASPSPSRPPQYLGTGLISVMGPSFAFLPIARELVKGGMDDGLSAEVAYGKFLGTCLVAALLEIGIALFPPRIIGKIFPPIVCGTAVTLIGAALTGARLAARQREARIASARALSISICSLRFLNFSV